MHLLLEPLLRLFAALVSHGGLPRQDRNQFGPVLIYPLRPGLAALLLAGLLFSVYALAINLPAALHGQFHALHPLPLALAAFLLPLSLLLFTRTLNLDEQGLHRRDILLGTTTITWPDLHHVERYASRSSGKDTFFLRSASTRTTITVPEMTYNTTHLLAEIRKRIPLPEQPRRRRHWYGG